MAGGIPNVTFPPGLPRQEEDTEITNFDFDKISMEESHRFGNTRTVGEFRQIGRKPEGNFGTIYKVMDRTDGKIYAMKQCYFTEDMLEDGVPPSLLREISIRKLLKHDNIVNFHGSVVGKDLNSNFLLMDYCVISLQDLMDKSEVCKDAIFSNPVIKYVMKSLCNGVLYLHKSTVAHRNISTSNLLFTVDGILKIGGFRTVRWYSRRSIMSPTVTDLRFRAPELLFKAEYGLPADIWAVGCVFAHLYLRTPIFNGDSELEMLNSIMSVLGTPSERIWPGFDLILKKGTIEEREIVNPQPYADFDEVLENVPTLCSMLIRDILIYYPEARLKAHQIFKSHYFRNEMVRACKSKVLLKIIEAVLHDPITID